MALAPRSSLRSLVLLLSHRKPPQKSFSSAADPPPRNCTPVVPAVQPPAAPALPDGSSHKGANHEEIGHQLHDPPPRGNSVIGKRSPPTLEYLEHPDPLLCTVDEDPKKPTPDYSGSCSSRPEPVTGPETRENVGHDLPDPTSRGKAVIRKSSPSTLEYPEHPDHLPCAVEDPKKPTPDDSGSCSSTPEPVTGSGRGNVDHKLRDPPSRRP